MKKMGLFDKVKNMFTEEVEDDEVKVEQIKSDVKKVSIESPNVKQEDEMTNQRLRNFGALDDYSNSKQEDKIKKPVFFTDKDFDDLLSKPKKEENKEIYRETSKNNYSVKFENKKEEERKIFKPTPIISPVYGILDKNYHKEDIVSKNNTPTRTSADGLSVDSVRNKAYGTLEEELENTLFGQNSILFNDKTEEDNTKEENDFFDELEKEAQPDILDELKDDSDYVDPSIEELDEITMDIEKELDSILNKKTKKENTVNESNDNLNEEDLFELIDSMYEGEDK